MASAYSKRVLVLAGSGESPLIANALAAEGHVVISAWAEPARGVAPFTTRPEVTDLSSPARLADHVAARRIDAVVDASHCFDRPISEAAATLSLPHVQVVRPEWQPVAGDRWQLFDGLEDAVAVLNDDSRVLAATGRGSELAFASCHALVFLRQNTHHEQRSSLPNVRYLFGDPPFSMEGEAEQFRELALTHVLVRNTGGDAGYGKIAAARRLELDVLMLRRPAPPPGLYVPTVDAALDWVRGL